MSRRRVGDSDERALHFALLMDAEELPPGCEWIGWRFHFDHGGFCAKLWAELGAEALERWIREHPGTRPSTWWRLDAPRQPIGRFPGCYYDGKLPEARRRVGGRGTPVFEVLGYVPEYEYGMPRRWVSGFEIDLYSGRAIDVHGKPIMPEYIGNTFAAERFDRDDPPIFESEATFLERHGLLLPGERRRLRRADFVPEILPDEYWPT